MLQEIKTDLQPLAAELELKRLKVPRYQRAYSWTEKQVNEYLHDIGGVISSGGSEYFMGSIVLSRAPDSETRLDVVDGQQRLATTVMLVAIIRNILKKLKEDVKANEIQRIILKMDLRTEQIEPQLVLSDEDNAYFMDRVLKERRNRQPLPQANKPSHELINNAFSAIELHLSSELRKRKSKNDKVGYLLDWVEFIKKSAKVIEINVPDHSNAFTVFETLNDRGLELSTTDLIKNHLFLSSGKRVAETQNAWANLVGALQGIDEAGNVINFIRHYWSSRHEPIREREVYAHIKKAAKNEETSIKLLNDLLESSKVYVGMVTGGGEVVEKFGDPLKEAISVYNMLGVSQIRPLLIAVIEGFRETEVQRSVALLTAAAVRSVVVGRLGGGTLESAYSNLSIQIRKKKINDSAKLVRELKKYVPNDVEFEKAFSSMVVGKSRISRYYLRKLEFQAQGKSEFIPNPDADKVNLEHVLPKSPSAGWGGLSPDVHTANLNRLGNHCLLDKQVNGKVGNNSFTDKIADLKSSPYILTKEVANNTNWGPAEIEARQKRLAALAVNVWSL